MWTEIDGESSKQTFYWNIPKQKKKKKKNGSEQNPSLVENWTSKKRNVINLTSKRACWHDDDEQVQAEHTF